MTQNPYYDFVFCGAGASASLLLLSLHEKGLLTHKSVLVIDREVKTGTDRTFCFWSKADEQIVRSLREIISHTWSQTILADGSTVPLKPYHYHHVSGVDLHRRTLELEVMYGWSRIVGSVDSIEPVHDAFLIQVDTKTIRAGQVFDSRTPHYQPQASLGTHIFQSFVGWRIKLKDKLALPQAIRLMDFNVEQQESTQFMYVLPYSSDLALVELTRFGSEILDSLEASAVLSEYIESNYGEFEKIEEERGCIPMSTLPIQDENIRGVIYLGARNFAIKPSTGYAFKRMFYDAEKIATTLKEGTEEQSINRTYGHVSRGRFAFYDGLLLDILDRYPHEGKTIFDRLFRRNSISVILNFLDEQSHVREEARIFYRLPLLPFLKSLSRRVLRHAAFVPGMLLMLCTLFAMFSIQSHEHSGAVSAMMMMGLMAIGIPHGALDHLIEGEKWERRRLPLFMLKYVSIGVIMFLFWKIWPSLSLLAFILYSSWHFGQADGMHWSMPRIQSFVWGLSVLTFILGTHTTEANAILIEMGVSISWPVIPVWSMLPWFILFGASRNVAGIITVSWLMISCQIPLMIAFGLYFIGQHSWVGWGHIKSRLRMSHLELWIHALPFHAMAWGLLGFFLYLQKSNNANGEIFSWGNIFIFLACMSTPHVFIMHTMYRQGQSVRTQE